MIAGLPYDFRTGQQDGALPFYRMPNFSEHKVRLFVRYIRPYIEASQRHAAVPRLTTHQRAVMDVFDSLIYDKKNQAEMFFQPDDMQFLNNYHVLHRRKADTDNARAGRVRWLKHLWLATEILASEDRPSHFQAGTGTAHWIKRLTKA